MVTVIKLLKKILLIVILLIIILGFLNYFKPIEKLKIRNSLFEEVSILNFDGQKFRDLNKNNLLDIYEDHRLSSELRAEDLISKMKLEEKVGQMFHPPFTLKPDIWM